MMKAILKPRWILTSLLVFLGVGALIRLGFWQLQRLEERRAFNARVLAQLNEPEINLNNPIPVDGLLNMEYRVVSVAGIYDHTQEVLLRNQVWEDKPGYHILTPLRIQGSNWSVLVDRGWISLEDARNLKPFELPGLVTIKGRLRSPQTKPDFGGVPDPTLAAGEIGLFAWNVVNLERIQQQVTFPLLPVYIQQEPNPAGPSALPVPTAPLPEISEGSHLGYAFQFFGFAFILAFGYPFYLRQQLK
ncbi:MAG: SURF1 family protein [Anaerolineae bacterium]|nr:SURF1 family protein [Anaerolineae bacterium]